MVTAEQLAEWRRLAEAATPGPWGVCRDQTVEPERLIVWNGELTLVCTMGDFTQAPTEQAGKNARLVSAARNAVPALCDEVARLQQQVAALTQERDEARAELAAVRYSYAAAMDGEQP